MAGMFSPNIAGLLPQPGVVPREYVDPHTSNQRALKEIRFAQDKTSSSRTPQQSSDEEPPYSNLPGQIVYDPDNRNTP